MRSLFLPFMIMVGTTLSVRSQNRVNKLPAPVNHPSISASAPYVSLDGNSLLFVSDNAEDNALTVFYSTKADGINWREPVMLPKNIHSRLNFLRGFSISPDGRQIFISTMKSGGVGGYDLFASDLKGYWQEPVNVGLPVNSKEHEACASLSADGLTMYFMRCPRMSTDKAEGCKILMSKRKANGPWQPPVELPDYINTGNSQAPRIMGDDETLIFSSNQIPGKGGMDLFATKWNGTAWGKPVSLEFANTGDDDEFVSATSLGRYLMTDAQGRFKRELVEILFPVDVKPKGVMKVEGRISGPANLASPYISVFSKGTQKRIFNLRPTKEGAFTVYLKEGDAYNLTVDPEQDNFTFFSKEFDLAAGLTTTLEKVNVSLKTLSTGDELELGNVKFKLYSIELEPSSDAEIRKVVRLINGNPSLNFAVDVSLFGYLQDSVQSSPDLTEVITDTLRIPVTRTRLDSAYMASADSTAIDSAQMFITETVDSLVIKNTYHNDRTPHQTLELVNYLISQGVSAGRLTPTYHANEEAIIENKKTLVKIIAR